MVGRTTTCRRRFTAWSCRSLRGRRPSHRCRSSTPERRDDEGDLYADLEQTLVKHFILEHYLERFAHIVGSAWDAITYVDCFAGPWNARSEHLEDSSFALALAQLRAARTNLADLKLARGRPPLELRCFFLEKDAARSPG
jgi:hypothetical protein